MSEVLAKTIIQQYNLDVEMKKLRCAVCLCLSVVQAIREGRMPESMQLVARVNAEAGGKVSVFDRLASTTTESRRQKVNDRDQLHENLR